MTQWDSPSRSSLRMVTLETISSRGYHLLGRSKVSRGRAPSCSTSLCPRFPEGNAPASRELSSAHAVHAGFGSPVGGTSRPPLEKLAQRCRRYAEHRRGVTQRIPTRCRHGLVHDFDSAATNEQRCAVLLMRGSLQAADAPARVPPWLVFEWRGSCRPTLQPASVRRWSALPKRCERTANALELAIVGILGIVGIGINRERGARLTPLAGAIGLWVLR